MTINLARLMNDWFEEHHPYDYVISPHDYYPNRIMLKHNKPCHAVESSYIGEISDVEFFPWIGATNDAFVYYAADPEFFNKIDIWFKKRILDDSWMNKIRDGGELAPV